MRFSLLLFLLACTSEKPVIEENITNSIQDIDGDGYVLEDDCDENNPLVNISAEELCDGIDNNCDGEVDEGVQITYYLDYDGDGFGDDTRPLESCSLPVGYVPNGNDCDDSNEVVFPGAIEVCDGLDNDCNDEIDEGTGGVVYMDADGDGYGDPNTSIDGCEESEGYVDNALDCDDSNGLLNPGAFEVCDEIDNNCDGSIDEGLTSTYYVDSDGDGFGDPNNISEACFPISGYVTDSSDCDDTSAVVNPNQFEACDAIDNNCDGFVDEGVTNTYYADLDQDGFGDPAQSVEDCSVPFAYTDNNLDCDDNINTVNPDGSEECNGLDDDCDGFADAEYMTGSIYTDIYNCGSCDNDCTSYGYVNATPSCDVSLPLPECSFSCDSGYFDANGDASDGCECEFINSSDAPFDGLDADCDGADGDHGDAIHVSTTGSPNGLGTIADPLLTIQSGINAAVSSSKTFVLVGSGNYNENVTIEDGIFLLGSMDLGFLTRSTDMNPSVITGDGASPALIAFNITNPTEVDGFQVWSPNSGGSGASAIGIFLQDCTDSLVFRDNIIGADDAEDGVDGSLGSDGSNGNNGLNGLDTALTTCVGSRLGGSGGSNICNGVNISGGDGAFSSCPFASINGNNISSGVQPYGVDGYGNNGGFGGTGACDGILDFRYGCGSCIIDTACNGSGDIGTNGGEGIEGSGGSGATSSGYLVGMQWVSQNGTNGADGTNGSGGGGGGAGSGGDSNSCGTAHGSGTGGGGGSGGCLGSRGIAGTGGGSSFAVFYNCTSSCTALPLFLDNEISAGDGGNGGDGGDGGLGGLGGYGGYGGTVSSTAWCAGDGGAGGLGGNGGDGGGAGGGSGGQSFAVFVTGVTPDPIWVDQDNDLDGGLPGFGGRGGRGGSSANDGQDGVSGDNGDQNW